MPPVIDTVIYQHAENVCSLWWQWQRALDEPHYDYKDLQLLEKRIEANLAGLRLAGDHALIPLRELIDAQDEGAVFAAATLAVESSTPSRFLELADAASMTDSRLTELTSALAWAEQTQLQNIVTSLLDSKEPDHVILGLQACKAHGRDPGRHLHQCSCHEDGRIRTEAYRLAANLGNIDVLGSLPATPQGEPTEQFELARAYTLLGRRNEGRLMLEELALGSHAISSRAVRLMLLTSDSAAGRSLLKTLNGCSGRERDVVRGFGLLGDPNAIEWLISHGDSLPLGRLAGESITMITGVDLAYENLDMKDDPEGALSPLNDDPADDHVALNEDDNLPWPDKARLLTWWQTSPDQLVNGTQYLCGHVRSLDTYQHVLQTGRQRQRSVAADLMSLARPGTSYRNIRLPTIRQAFCSSTGSG